MQENLYNAKPIPYGVVGGERVVVLELLQRFPQSNCMCIWKIISAQKNEATITWRSSLVSFEHTVPVYNIDDPNVVEECLYFSH